MLLIRGGQILTENATALQAADILVQQDRIVALGADLPAPEGARVFNAHDHIVLPGLINCHTHAHNNLLKGFEDNRTLEEARAYGPVIYANRTIEDQYVSAAIGAIEMVKTGCTTAFDMFTAMPAMTDESVEAVVRAYTDVGLRAVLGPSMNDEIFYRAVPGLLDLLPPDLVRAVDDLRAAPTDQLLRMAENAIRRWHGSAWGRIAIATAPAVPGECSDRYLAGMVELVQRYGVRLQTHLAETKMQAVFAVERWGRPLSAQLAELGVVGPNFIGGHGVWLTDEEIRILGGVGAAISHNPASNLKLGSGIAPVREMLQASVIVGLGSDGSMSSDNQNMFEAMRFAALANKVRFPHDPENWLGSNAAWQMATTGGARALGFAD
ncbi:MAG: amidohydrolase family protein, partial [Bradyrhizobium sp.]